jgi:crotonobetainyl-CoA:carnitine CoA-transferase CaiB-like acyl-CoA transferase
MTTDECLKAMEIANVPCVPVNTISEIASHQIIEESNATVDMVVEGDRVAKLVQTPLWFSSTPVSARLSPPRLGEHTDEILNEIGYNAESIRKLKESRVIQ